MLSWFRREFIKANQTGVFRKRSRLVVNLNYGLFLCGLLTIVIN
jgi:hypothetical protein